MRQHLSRPDCAAIPIPKGLHRPTLKGLHPPKPHACVVTHAVRGVLMEPFSWRARVGGVRVPRVAAKRVNPGLKDSIPLGSSPARCSAPHSSRRRLLLFALTG